MGIGLALEQRDHFVDEILQGHREFALLLSGHQVRSDRRWQQFFDLDAGVCEL
ncbi:Uncharacterised protein [Mycobacteroides abscessus subsp. abscessus]|nr:Uncharacterised protein [Mycobacteroides abscessus subsp. abscessus]